MMEWVLWSLAAWTLLLLAGLWACTLASVLYYRPYRGPARPLLPMSIVKPVKGLDDELAENFEALAAADPAGALQIVIAVETRDDPAYPVLKAFADAHSGRGVDLVLTGPSGARMGKIHNMIEGLSRARHPIALFSDADIRPSPELLAETAEAFREGAEAVFAAPYHAPTRGLGAVFFQIAFNHGFTVPLALCARLGALPAAAGAWMGFTREALSRAGGLLPHARAIADDYAVSRAVVRSGARARLLRTTVRVNESGQGAAQAFAHLAKWMTIIRWSQPPGYFLLPLICPGLFALLYALAGGGWGLLAAALASRAAAGLLQDLKVGGAAMPWYGYLVLALADFGAPVFWLAGLRREVSWRGKRYRLRWGGEAEVLDPSGEKLLK